MKLLKGIKHLLLTALMVYIPVAQAVSVDSDFGYSMELPDGTLVMSAKELQQNPELFDIGLNALDTRKDIISMARGMVETGQIELFFLPGDAPEFADNINVLRQPMPDIPVAEFLPLLCPNVAEQFSSMFNRSIQVYTCEERSVGGQPSIYLSFDGALEGTRNMQYFVRQSGGTSLIFTATAANASSANVGRLFDQAMQTVRLH